MLPSCSAVHLAATPSDWSENAEWLDDVELINDLGTEMLVPDDVGYTQQVEGIASLLLLMIFFMGISAGLACGSLMFRRLR